MEEEEATLFALPPLLFCGDRWLDGDDDLADLRV
jgi:hypothetical protein